MSRGALQHLRQIHQQQQNVTQMQQQQQGLHEHSEIEKKCMSSGPVMPEFVAKREQDVVLLWHYIATHCLLHAPCTQRNHGSRCVWQTPPPHKHTPSLYKHTPEGGRGGEGGGGLLQGPGWASGQRDGQNASKSHSRRFWPRNLISDFSRFGPLNIN